MSNIKISIHKLHGQNRNKNGHEWFLYSVEKRLQQLWIAHIQSLCAGERKHSAAGILCVTVGTAVQCRSLHWVHYAFTLFLTLCVCVCGLPGVLVVGRVDEGMLQHLVRCYPLHWVQAKHSFQQVHEGTSSSFSVARQEVKHFFQRADLCAAGF